MLAGLLTRFGLYGGLFGAAGGIATTTAAFRSGDRLLVSVVTYFLSRSHPRDLALREFAADRGRR